MCVQSQFIPCAVLWAGFNPLGPKEGIFVVLHGYIDESCDGRQNLFALSCIMAKGKDWSAMERRWKILLAAKNKELIRAGRKPISRYHASDCSGCKDEFKGWSRDERDAFVLKLFGEFKKLPSHTVAIDAHLDELIDVFPEWANERLKAAYHLLTQYLMRYIARDFDNLAPGNDAKITLFHDRTGGDGAYDPTMLKAFNDMRNSSFSGARYFTTIAPLGWENCIALQPADLVAFECLKQAQAKDEARISRKSFDALIDMDAFGIHSLRMNRHAMIQLRTVLEKEAASSP
jgi:hypothetical protein